MGAFNRDTPDGASRLPTMTAQGASDRVTGRRDRFAQ